MANLVLQQNDDGLEFHVDTETNQAYASQSATARMCGVKSENTIRKWITSHQIQVLEAEIQTATGFKTAHLLTSESVFEAALRYCPELAKKMGSAGANVFMLGLAGYKIQAVEPAKPKTALELAKEQVKLLEQLELQQQQIKILEEHTLAQAEVIDELFDYSSIIRIAKYNNCDEKAFGWHKLKAAAKTIGEEIKKAPCPRCGEKNLYSHNTWRLAYPEYRLPETTTLRIA